MKIARLSQALVPTLRPDGSHNASSSHNLLLRGGFVRQSSAGIYTFLPLGMRVLAKLELLADKHMHRIGAQRIAMPSVLPADLWKRTGRWNSTETFKLADRKGARYLLAPTHEEEATSLASGLVASWRDLPLRVYQ